MLVVADICELCVTRRRRKQRRVLIIRSACSDSFRANQPKCPIQFFYLFLYRVGCCASPTFPPYRLHLPCMCVDKENDKLLKNPELGKTHTIGRTISRLSKNYLQETVQFTVLFDSPPRTIPTLFSGATGRISCATNNQ